MVIHFASSVHVNRIRRQRMSAQNGTFPIRCQIESGKEFSTVDFSCISGHFKGQSQTYMEVHPMVTRPQSGSIIKRHGAWHWRYYDNGKQRSVKLAEVGEEFRAKKDVVSLANERAAQLTPRQPVSGNVLVCGFADKEYFPWLREQKRAATVDGYEKIWRGHLQDHFAEIRLAEYRPHHASAFLTGLAKKGLGRNSVSHV